MLNLQVAAVVLLAAGALPEGCGGLAPIDTKVQLKDVCREFPTEAFDAADPQQTGVQTVDKTLNVEVAKYARELEEAGGRDLQLTLNSVKFTPATGIEDFGFVNSASIELLATENRPALPLLSYTKTEAAPKELVIQGQNAELTSYQGEEQVALRAQLTGVFPQSAWTTTITACFKVGASIDLDLNQK